jgi:hypothetical protein
MNQWAAGGASRTNFVTKRNAEECDEFNRYLIWMAIPWGARDESRFLIFEDDAIVGRLRYASSANARGKTLGDIEK